jgi:DNA-3-methyladenine glycosylase
MTGQASSNRTVRKLPSADLLRKEALTSDFYLRDTVSVARDLLGCILWRRIGNELVSARLVEVEAYLGANDAASHARRGLRTERNEAMYLPGGHAYVYLSYGMHWCMNVVTAEADIAEAILLRAAQPIVGIEAMHERRPKARKEFDIANGPGKLCAAMAIDRELNGAPLDGPALFITPRDIELSDDDIAVSARIGVENSGEAAHWPLRFFLRGNRYVSAYRHAG